MIPTEILSLYTLNLFLFLRAILYKRAEHTMGGNLLKMEIKKGYNTLFHKFGHIQYWKSHPIWFFSNGGSSLVALHWILSILLWSRMNSDPHTGLQYSIVGHTKVTYNLYLISISESRWLKDLLISPSSQLAFVAIFMRYSRTCSNWVVHDLPGIKLYW